MNENTKTVSTASTTSTIITERALPLDKEEPVCSELYSYEGLMHLLNDANTRHMAVVDKRGNYVLIGVRTQITTNPCVCTTTFIKKTDAFIEEWYYRDGTYKRHYDFCGE